MKEVVVGVISNGGQSVMETFYAMQENPHWALADWIVVESNSNDNTVEKLSELTEVNPNFKFVSLEPDQPEATRVQRIRRARNAYVALIRELEVDRVTVVDFDAELLRGGIVRSPDIVSLETEVVSAAQGSCYFDIFAFRALGSPNLPIRERIRTSSGRILAWLVWIIPLQIWLSLRTKRRLRVDSAFGGLAIYPAEVFRLCDYSPVDTNTEVCEHVDLHAKAREAGFRVVIDPNLVYGVSNEHCFTNLAKRIFQGLFQN